MRDLLEKHQTSMVIARRHSHTLDFFTRTEEKHLQEKKRLLKFPMPRIQPPKRVTLQGASSTPQQSPDRGTYRLPGAA